MVTLDGTEVGRVRARLGRSGWWFESERRMEAPKFETETSLARDCIGAQPLPFETGTDSLPTADQSEICAS